MPRQLARRIAVAAVAIPATIGVVYIGGWLLVATLAALGVLGARELYQLATHRGIRAFTGCGYLGAALIPVAAFLALPAGSGLAARWLAFGAALWLICVMSVATLTRPADQGPIAAIAVTTVGALYAGGLPAFLLLLRHPAGVENALGATALAFLPLVGTWICDTAAMAGGAAFGGPKLAPRISPGKTWAGAITGTVGALAAAPLYGRLVLERSGISVSLPQLLLCGLVVATLGQLGDLAESLLKREAGVKDSGAFFPGHGGVLDRLDSLYWSVPGVAFVLALGGTI